MRHPTIEDVAAVDTVANGMRATRNLRDHAPGDGAVIDKRIEFVGSGLADERRCVVDVVA